MLEPVLTETEVSSINATSTTWAEIVDRLRIEIAAWIRKESVISKVYRENLAVLLGEFGTFNYLNAEEELVPVNCFVGTPERTIAKLRQKNTITLPVISVVQTNTEADEGRAKFEPMLVYGTLWNEETKRAQRIISTVPKAVNINYEITLWAKYKNDLDQLVEQIILTFNPSKRIETRYTTESIAILGGESNESSIVLGDKEERVLKKKFDIKIMTYLPKPVFLLTNTGKIENFYVDAGIA